MRLCLHRRGWMLDNRIYFLSDHDNVSNIYSCPFIATQDLGKTKEDGSFSVLGRFDNSDVRGCNLLIQ